MRRVVVTGTGTEVGKTYVGAAVLGRLRRDGREVAARKPAQSHGPGEVTTDAAVLAAATGEEPEEVCPPGRTFEVPMAPPMAAAALGRSMPATSDLAALIEASWPEGAELGLVEGAGGVRSPLGADGDCLALIVELRPDLVVLVADAGLGTINAVRLCLDALQAWPVVVHLNRFDARSALHRANLEYLAADGAELTTTVEDLALLVAG